MKWKEFVAKVDAELRSKQIDPESVQVDFIDWPTMSADEDVLVSIVHMDDDRVASIDIT